MLVKIPGNAQDDPRECSRRILGNGQEDSGGCSKRSRGMFKKIPGNVYEKYIKINCFETKEA